MSATPGREATATSYWDAIAATGAFGHPVDAGRLADLVGLRARVLDCGCGYGRVAPALRSAGFRRVVGVDPSAAMLARARREAPGVPFARADGGRLPFASGSFDAALLLTVLTSVPSDAAQRAIVDEVARVLRPGGVLWLSDLPLQDDPARVARYEAFAGRLERYGDFRLPDGGVFRHHDPAWIDSLTAGFDPVERSDLDVVTMNGNPARAFRYIGRRR